jgi:ADP-ribose pyrophosphatase YjhB (NUDIX family)
MYVDAKKVEEVEAKLGKPEVQHLEFPIGDLELAFVRATQKHGRAHDVTLFIFKDEHLALIRKPMFQRPIYRAPSGGLNPGESFEEGAKREALEETGLEIELEKYLLRIHVRFTAEDDHLDWTSHVFQAREVGGRLEAHDTTEIAETIYSTVEELQGPIRQALLGSGRRLLAYRAALTDAVVDVLGRQGRVSYHADGSNEQVRGHLLKVELEEE